MAEDKGIPTLTEVVRRGDGQPNQSKPQQQARATGLSDEEIEQIANRVMERYREALEKTIARAIRRALERKEGKKG
ncbi:MAG: hypothetical protein R3225_09150 [Halofilum sp. (in: g-proteobacteria)]|nr:hypothetical protein [Halofilum sp. (in: g-proteobacteria)]